MYNSPGSESILREGAPIIVNMRVRKGVCVVVLLPALMASGGMPASFAADQTPAVLNGVDVLRRDNFAPLAGKRVGLVTNHTGLAADGASTVELLSRSGVCKLVALFSPEHGIRGVLDARVGSSVDAQTGLPVHSLYGETNRPSPEMLRGVDALVYDIQDIGARFYTYATTLAYCLEEAAKARIPVYVLDRPNPIGGILVEGPMLDPDKTSFIGYMPFPVRHGMTIGELARYFNAENRILADLHVIPMSGWRREHYFPDTGQLWVNPSPNMRSVLQAIFYPGLCLLERANISLGRGTDRPFEVIGAPWIEPRRLAAELNRAALPGVKFTALVFTPIASTHEGRECGGVQLVLTDLASFRPVITGLTAVAVLRRLYPDAFEVDAVLKLLGNESVLAGIKSGLSPAAALDRGREQLRKFMESRRKHLIYR